MLRSYQAVFRSRWRAVIWSMGVMLTAYCSVPSADDSAQGDGLTAVAKLVASKAGKQGENEERRVNPWALPPKPQP